MNITIAEALEKQDEVCQERYVRRPGLFAVIVAILGVAFSAWGIVSVAINHSERITVLETKQNSVDQMNEKLDTLLKRTGK